MFNSAKSDKTKKYLQGAPVAVEKNGWSGNVTLFDGIRAPEWTLAKDGKIVSGKIK